LERQHTLTLQSNSSVPLSPPQPAPCVSLLRTLLPTLQSQSSVPFSPLYPAPHSPIRRPYVLLPTHPSDGVPYLPSSAPGCRMTDFFLHRSLIANPDAASKAARAYSPAMRTRAGLIYTAPDTAHPVYITPPSAEPLAFGSSPSSHTLSSRSLSSRSLSSRSLSSRSLSSRFLYLPEVHPVTAGAFPMPMAEPHLGSPLRTYASPNRDLSYSRSAVALSKRDLSGSVAPPTAKAIHSPPRSPQTVMASSITSVPSASPRRQPVFVSYP